MVKRQTKRRPKGEGSVAVMANGKLRMTITIGRGIDGKQKRKVVTASTRQELLDKAAEVRLKYKVGNYKELINTNITFEEYVEKWLDKKSYSVSIGTAKNYKYALKRCNYLNDIQLNKITSEDINTVILSLKEATAGGVKFLKAILTSIFNSALDDEMITKNPMRGTLKPAKSRKKVDLTLPSESQVKELLEVAKRRGENTRQKSRRAYFRKILYPFLLLAISSGMRRGELAGLQWSSIDFKTNKIKVERQITTEGAESILKTESSYRTISIEPTVLKVIESLREENEKDNDFVFIRSVGGAAGFLGVITKEVRALFDTVGFDREISLHSLRHFHATQLIKHGINVKVVSKRLGHSNIQTTLDIYVHWLPSMDEEASLIIGKNYVLI